MKKALIFVSGFALGCAAGMYVAKKKYDELIKEEVKSVKETLTANSKKIFRTKKEEEVSDDTPVEEVNENRPPVDYTKGTHISVVSEDVFGEVVSEDEFGEEETYEKILLTLYADDILADEDDEELTEDEIKGSVTRELLDKFIKSEEDVLYICNDTRKCYYEVTKDLRPYHSLK